MDLFYLTPASISYLNQALLTAIITGYLIYRFPQNQQISTQDKLLVLFFLVMTLFSLTLFLDVSLLPSESLVVGYLQNPILALLILILAQFAYFFPTPQEKQAQERRVVLLLTLLYLLSEGGYAFWRFYRLGLGRVEYRYEAFDYPVLIAFFWVVWVFARGTLSAWQLPASRRFALIFLIPVVLAFLNILVVTLHMGSSFFQMSMSIGILCTIALFALNYLASKPEITPLMIKISCVALTVSFAILGIIPWLVAPPFVEQYKPELVAPRTLRFSPNQTGGYEVVEIPYRFEESLGENLGLAIGPRALSQARISNFTFPFFGKPYEQLSIITNGLIVFGAEIEYRDLEYQLANVPAIFPLLVGLNPEANPEGGIFLRRAPQQLIITYSRLQAFYRERYEFTFQVVLYADGRFDLTYLSLPSKLQYFVNDRPDVAPWVLGVQAGHDSRPEFASFTQLPLTSGPQGVIQDEYRTFRHALHTFLVPLTLAILGSSLFLVLGIPLLLNGMLARPLTALLKGVEAYNQGALTQAIPVHFNDEIGFLTMSFNHLGAELDGLIKNLEQRVGLRTAELVRANDQLRKLSSAVEQSPSTIVITDKEARIEYVNPAFTRSTGYTLEEVLGQNPRLLKSNITAPEVYVDLWQTLRAGETWRGELCNRRKRGETYWEYSVIAPIFDQAGLITHFVAVKEDISARKKIEAELHYLAITDPLTGLYNRRYFFIEAHKIFQRTQTPPHELALLMIDLDHFKKINDTYGHLEGDQVLRAVARSLEGHLRPADLLGRYGGEEFVALISRTLLDDVCQIAERLLQALRETPIMISSGQTLSITVSIGIAPLNNNTPTLDQLISNADQALYQAKNSGRNKWALSK